ncbi:MAG: M23 family metallopeptidase [Burkholderiales bacterium]|nr:M23 family metallopeptidase [Burkholderiales bacterium]
MVAALALSGVVAALATIGDSPEAERLLPKTVRPEPLAIAFGDALLPAPASYVYVERFQRGDTIAALAARLAIAESEVRALARLAALRHLRPGTSVSAEVTPEGVLLSLAFLGARDRLVRIERGADGALVARETVAALARWEEAKSAEIRSSLFAAADAAGVPDSVALQLADIFGGDIDFHRDLRKGDRFSVVYEVFAFEGRALRPGRVLAAEFVNQGRTHRAVWFQGGESGGYYAPDGTNLRKAFLRSPLEFSRVSSGFGLRRHPFLQTWRAHQGVDYAAPLGTRVRATGDGIVEFAGRSGGYGNVVVLRHGGGQQTLYAHLSGFARGIRSGARVAQGETIGFVGQTGWATGPHLHYEFRVGGVARDPLRIALPAAQPLPAHALAAFREQAAPLLARLAPLAATQIAQFE